MIDEIKGFADDVNRLREQSKLMESSELAAQVISLSVCFYILSSLLLCVVCVAITGMNSRHKNKCGTCGE